MIKEPEYSALLKYIRNGLVEQIHFGIILHMNKKGVIKKIGNDNNYKFYHRSCMKPLQAAILTDLGIDKKYNLSLEEIALCCASHTGDEIHQKNVLSVLRKGGFCENDLLCSCHEPLSKDEQKKLILNNEQPGKIHNNCSGKHSAMLLVCKEKGYDIKNYTDINHPLSSLIINNVCRLCETDEKDIIISKDGCTLPVIATNLETLGRGFLNLFCNPKYERIKQAFLNYPYHIGGNYRLDSEIIAASKNHLIAKVGACGLCVVVNPDKEECIVVKIADSNMEARTVVTVNALLQLNWQTLEMVESCQLSKIYNNKISCQNGEIVGEITDCFNLN